jgi:methylated-DNA-[protein]-cysteine S-methyltransferase
MPAAPPNSSRITHHASRITWTALATPLGTLRLFGLAGRLVALALPDEPAGATEARLRRALGALTLVEAAAGFEAAREQLAAYVAGRPVAFDLPLDPRGTPFQRAVWAAVAAVPHGETRSYAQIAAAIGRPAATRAVGLANGANPLPIIIPCHRIIGADGALTGYGGGLPFKRALLALERGAPPAAQLALWPSG